MDDDYFGSGEEEEDVKPSQERKSNKLNRTKFKKIKNELREDVAENTREDVPGKSICYHYLFCVTL